MGGWEDMIAAFPTWSVGHDAPALPSRPVVGRMSGINKQEYTCMKI